MRILMTGASGFLGRTLTRHLRACGHQVVPLIRSDVAALQAPTWQPEKGQLNLDSAGDLDAVVHLAGESIFGRWTRSKKHRIRFSRTEGTRLLCRSLGGLARPPSVLVSASAIGIYGNRGHEDLFETSPAGTGFLSEVAQDWEEACSTAADEGIRVVQLRFGIVLSPEGGALARMLPIFKCGLGGRIGEGTQIWSWIALDDLHAILHLALRQPTWEGAINTVAPHPVSNFEFTRTLARVLRRPALFPVPEKIIRFVLGEMGEATLLASQKVVPQVLLNSGYAFRHSELESALRHLLGR